MHTSTLLAALLSASFALVNAAPNLQKRVVAFTVLSCNSCASAGDGFPVCTTDPYIHLGAGGTSCSDKTAPINDDFCSAFGTINTPTGAGTLTAVDCSAAAGQVAVTINTATANYSCTVDNTAAASNSCGGLTYACVNKLDCSQV